MAETANTTTDMESNNNPVKGPAKVDNIRQRVPQKRERPQRLKGYVSPFLADKAQIDAKFVHLQCVWRDLEHSRQLGKKVFKERPVDHKPRGKIKHKEDYLDPGVTIKPPGITPEFKTGVSRLLRLERQLDENDNELKTTTTKVVEYRNVVHKKDKEPIGSVFAIENRVQRTNVESKNKSDANTPSQSTCVEKKTVTRTVKPLKLSTKNLRVRSFSNSSDDSRASQGPKRRTVSQRINSEAPNTGKITLTKPNSPIKTKTENGQWSHSDFRTSSDDKVDHFDRKKRTSERVRSKEQVVELKDTKEEEKSVKPSVSKQSSERSSETKSSGEDINQNSLKSLENKTTSVRIQLDSSFSEDDHQFSPDQRTGERKISVKNSRNSPKSTTKRDNQKETTNETPVSVLVESESDTDMNKSVHKEIKVMSIKANKKRTFPSSPPNTESTKSSINDFNEKRKLFENLDNVGRDSSQDFKDKRKLFEKEEKNVGNPKKYIAAKLQNIQSNIHKIVTDIKQSKQATGHVKPSDVSSHDTTESNIVTTENTPLKAFPKAKQQGTSMEDKEADKQLKVSKDIKTSAQKTSASTLVAQGSKRQEKSQVSRVTSDTRQAIDNVQTLNGNQNSEGKLSDLKETDRVTVMNNKRARDVSDKQDTQHHKNESNTGQSKKKHLGHLTRVNADSDDNERIETSHEIVPVKGGGRKRIVRHKSSKGTGQDPEEVATDLQKALLTSKKVIERQLTGILDKRIESDNLVGALKRSMTKPTAREKVAAATHEIHEIIQNGVIQEENGSKIYQVRVQMGPFTGDIKYTQDGYTVFIEGSTTENPIFTKEIKVEFPTQGLDMELLSVHSIGSVVELNVPYLFVPSQSNGAVTHALDQYIYDEVSALKREYMQPWMNNDAPPPAATVTENSLVIPPSSLTKYMTEDDIKQAEELEIKPGEETKDILVTNLDPPKSPNSRRIPPVPKFAPPAPPQNGLDIQEERSMMNGKRPRRHRRNTSQSSNASVSSSETNAVFVNNSNNNNSSIQHLPIVEQSPREQIHVVSTSSKFSVPKNRKVHRSRKNRHSLGEIRHSTNGTESISPSYSTMNNGDNVERIENVTVTDSAPSLGKVVNGIQKTENPECKTFVSDKQDTLYATDKGKNSFKRDRSFRRSGKRRSLRKKGSNNTTDNKQAQYSTDSFSDETISDDDDIQLSIDRRYKDFSDSTDSECDRNQKSRKPHRDQLLTVPDIQVTEASSSGQE